MFKHSNYSFEKVDAIKFLDAVSGIEYDSFESESDLAEYCQNATFPTAWGESKYIISTYLLELAGLRTRSCRRYRRHIVNYIASLYKNGAKDVFAGLESASKENIWRAPAPRRSETERGYMSRLSAWVNMLLAENLERNWDGDIVSIPASGIAVVA